MAQWRWVVSGVMCLGLMGCRDAGGWRVSVDRALFAWLGRPVLSTPIEATLKEVHLDDGHLGGRDLLVEGKVLEVSEHGTFLVLSDDEARLLVVLTELEDAAGLLNREHPAAIRVMGSVETGTKGLPYLKARALSTRTTGLMKAHGARAPGAA